MRIKDICVVALVLGLGAGTASGQVIKINEENLGAPDLVAVVNLDVVPINLTGWGVWFWEDVQLPAGSARVFGATESVVTPGGPVMIMPGEEITIDDAPTSNSAQQAPGSQVYYWNANITFNIGESGASGILDPMGVGVDIIGHDNGNGTLLPILPAVPASGMTGVIGFGTPQTTFTPALLGTNGTTVNSIQRVGIVDTDTAADLIVASLGTPGSLNLGQSPPALAITSPGGNFGPGQNFRVAINNMTPGAPYVFASSIGSAQLPGIPIPGVNPPGRTFQLDLANGFIILINGFTGDFLGYMGDPTGLGVGGTGSVDLTFGIPLGLTGVVRTFQALGAGSGGGFDLTDTQTVTFN